MFAVDDQGVGFPIVGATSGSAFVALAATDPCCFGVDPADEVGLDIGFHVDEDVGVDSYVVVVLTHDTEPSPMFPGTSDFNVVAYIKVITH